MIIKNITKTVWRTNAEKCCATWREDQLHGVIIVFQFSLSWELCRHLHVLPFVVIRVTAPGEQQQYTFCMWQVATVIHTQYTKDPPPTATASPKYCHISSTMVWVFYPVISSPEQRLMTESSLPPQSSTVQYGSVTTRLTALYSEKPSVLHN